MKKEIKLTLSLLIATVMLFSCMDAQETIEPQKSIFNYEAADAYFSLIGKVKQTKEIADEDWTNFLNIDGNQHYIKENNMPDSYIEMIRTAILQTCILSEDSLAILAQQNPIIQIRNRYKQEEQLYKAHLKNLKINASAYLDSISQHTKALLPKGSFSKDNLPTIYYTALDHDGSANSQGIFISLMASRDFNKQRIGIFEAHELHHIMRPTIYQEVDSIAKKEEGLVWALSACLNEGLADMIDKDLMLTEQSDWWMKPAMNAAFVDGAKSIIPLLDESIAELANGTVKTEEDFRTLLQGSVGHIPGYYMAKIIKNSGKLDRVITNSANPFDFFILYNEIAEKTADVPTFSQAAIDHIQTLNQQYFYKK